MNDGERDVSRTPSEPSGTPQTAELPWHDGMTTAPPTAEVARPDDMENPFDTSIGSGVWQLVNTCYDMEA